MTEAEALVAENTTLRYLVEQLQQQLRQSQQRIAELEQRLGKDSQTSHKPPSSDGLAKKTRSLRQPSGKRPGGQDGHEGRTRPLVATPDVVLPLAATTCPHCQSELSAVSVLCQERRQGIDLPPIQVQVTGVSGAAGTVSALPAARACGLPRQRDRAGTIWPTGACASGLSGA